LDVHVAAALDANAGVLGVQTFPTATAGFAELHAWLCSFGTLGRVVGGIVAGRARVLRETGVAVVEVDRPNRQARRRDGKFDTVGAVKPLERPCRAARGETDGNVEAASRFLQLEVL
jgi:hypothetical protein